MIHIHAFGPSIANLQVKPWRTHCPVRGPSYTAIPHCNETLNES